ncbi:F-box/kelch-repeat protein At5g60570 [Selaginella moellendorffii]|nr:F-box/kelch-repeat protein At5g60570 [Selaginella moellendorffii]|eukprot:XP_002986659.2 F-box/kelch-repeat protein At5g60570 [Selaginella moellendorffii]
MDYCDGSGCSKGMEMAYRDHAGSENRDHLANGLRLSLQHPQNGRPKNGKKNGFHDRPKRARLNGYHHTSTSSSGFENGDPLEDEEHDEEQELIPGLTDDLALLCLARLPRSTYWQYFTVSRKFYDKLKRGEIYKARQQLGIVEQWMYILSDGHQRVWRAFNPRERTWRQLQSIPSDYAFEVSDKETLTAGTQLLVRGMEIKGYVVWIYDLVQDKWIKGPDMIQSRSLYASASCGNYGFVAGGTSMVGTDNLKSAERYNSVAGTWEPLPDLNRCRRLCSGFYMDGKFYVIGGKDGQDQLTCGEEYDPATGTWRLIPNMYFGTSEQSQTAPPLVAVVDNQLYALDTALNELKVYNKMRNDWRTLGEVPVRADFNSGWGIAFKAMEGELYVIGGQDAPDRIEIWAWRPARGGGAQTSQEEQEERPVWRYVTMLGTFIYNCAVMAA